MILPLGSPERLPASVALNYQHVAAPCVY